MQFDPEEEKLLRSVTLQNAQAVLRARERSERELREANQRVASILESITDGFVAFDLDWKIIYINGRAKEMIRPVFGRGENMLGRNHWEAFPESLGTPIEENYRRAVREQKTVHFEVFYPPLNAWYEIRAYPSPLGLSVYFQDITQRRRSAEVLREQREWLAVTLRSIGDGVIATDLRGDVTFLNPVAENMTGWKNEEAIGHPLGEVFKLVNEQTLAPAEAPIHKVLREKRVVGLANHTALIARNGTSTAIEDSAAPILNGEGNIAGAVMVFHDVTERRRTDAALRGSEERFAALVRASAQAVWVADASGEVAEYSPSWSAFTGQTFEEMKGWGRLNVIHSQDHAGLKTEWAKAIATRSPIEVDYRLWHVSGQWRWTTMRAVPLLDEVDAIRCWVAMNTDITERRAAEQRLRESENRKSAILNAALDAIITMDHHGRISDFNPAAEKIFGYSQFEAVGQPLEMLIIPEHLRERHRAGMKHYLATGEGPVLGRRIEMPALRKGGSEFPVELSISRIPDIEPPMFTATLRDISQRKRMENSLRDTAERAHATFNQAAVGIAIASLDGRFLELNQKFAEIAGYSIEELLTKTPLDITHPDDRASTADSMRKVVHGELPHYVMEKRYVRKDGEIVWILSTITVVRDANGVPQRFIGVIEDITQRRRAEEDLRLSRERLHLALTAGGLGDWEWDAATDLVTLGPRAAEIFGINAESITWTGLRYLLHEEDREVARVAVETALANHSDYNLEYRVLRRSGELVWVAARGRGRYASDGAVLGMSGVVADITERKSAEEVRFRLAAVVESSDDAIISMDFDTTITTWNKGAERTFGYTAAETVGKPILILIPSGRENEEPAILERLKRGERIEHYETVRVRKDGTLIDVSLSVSPVFDANGRIIGVSKISRDITARKQAEEALRKQSEELRKAQEELSHHAEDLEKQVAVRTASLTEALSQLEEFSYSVSHDLRAPLRAIAGYNRILEADFGQLLPPQAHTYLSKISRSTLRMERMVNDVLTMSRVARSEIQLHPISLQKFIEEIIEQHPGMQAPAADISIDTPHTVVADDAPLNQAISNLLNNAVKFVTSDRKPVIRVRSEKVGERVRLWVEDQGIGIPPQHRSKLFGMFQRLPVNLQYEGTGIGLAIVRKAAERMGGAVGMESNEPVGSRFWIELRAAQ